ncbi:MAG: hypothetical protein AAF081_12770 [Actinomycetota bacterium]
MTGPEAAETDARIVLHSSWTGIVMAVLGAVLLAVIAIVAWARAGATVVSLGATALTLVAMLVVAFDLPVATSFSERGLVRHTPLRRHEITWDAVARLKRARVGVHHTRRGKLGGLIANRGHRNYTLVDQLESPQEFDELRRVLGPVAVRLGLTDELRPPDGQPPTWLYRRKQWRPAGAR